MDRPDRKIFYTMGEVSEMLDVAPSLLRFWESKFDSIKPHKNKKGNRLFTPKDVENLKLIYHLVKERGMTLAGAQKTLKGGTGAVARDAELLERLMTVRSLLAEIRQELKSEEGEIYNAPPAEEYTAPAIAAPSPPALPQEPQSSVGEPQEIYEAQAYEEAEEEAYEEEMPDFFAGQEPEPEQEPEPGTCAEESAPVAAAEPAPKPLPRVIEQTLF